MLSCSPRDAEQRVSLLVDAHDPVFHVAQHIDEVRGVGPSRRLGQAGGLELFERVVAHRLEDPEATGVVIELDEALVDEVLHGVERLVVLTPLATSTCSADDKSKPPRNTARRCRTSCANGDSSEWLQSIVARRLR